MEVSHASDKITHAVIGGASAQNFGINASPEFIHMLSSTLYTNPLLAMCRETLCNAEDGHKMNNYQGPVEVILDENFLTIIDHGPGIPDDKMQEIYCVYGASTKKHDGNQTGGFGLGCKSPFSYTDHFDVTNHWNGKKTIYNMSKSSGEVAGMPGMVPIVSLPCNPEETGVTVKIPIKTPSDMAKIKKYIQSVAYYGDISVTLNKEPCEKAEYSSLDGIVNIVSASYSLANNQHGIFVKYGSVIYPVPDHEAYAYDLNKAAEFINRVNSACGSHDQNIIVFLAHPNTISVAPNRESLSLQDITINTLTELLHQLAKDIDFYYMKARKFSMDLPNHIGVNYKNSEEADFMFLKYQRNRRYHNNAGIVRDLLSTATAQGKFAPKQGIKYIHQHLARLHITSAVEGIFWKRIMNGTTDRKLAKQIDSRDIISYTGYFNQNRKYWYRHGVSKENIYVSRPAGWRNKTFTSIFDTLREAEFSSNILRKVVVIINSKVNTYERFKNLPPDIKGYLQFDNNFLLYVCKSKKKTELDKIIQGFEQKGFRVFNFMKKQAWEIEAVPELNVDKDYPIMGEAGAGNHYLVKETLHPRAAAYWVVANGCEIRGVSPALVKSIYSTYGANTIVVGSVAEGKAISKMFMTVPLIEKLDAMVKEAMETGKFNKLLSNDPRLMNIPDSTFAALLKTKYIQDKFPSFKNDLNPADSILYEIFKGYSIDGTPDNKPTKIANTVALYVKSLAPSPELLSLVLRINNNPISKFVNLDIVSCYLDRDATVSEDGKIAQELMSLIVKDA